VADAHGPERLFTLLLLHLETGRRVLLGVDDSPTPRYGPKVQGAGIHHNPTPGPTDQKFFYGHVWVTIALLLVVRSAASRQVLRPLSPTASGQACRRAVLAVYRWDDGLAARGGYLAR
jgi:hypothetical protein